MRAWRFLPAVRAYSSSIWRAPVMLAEADLVFSGQPQLSVHGPQVKQFARATVFSELLSDPGFIADFSCRPQ